MSKETTISEIQKQTFLANLNRASKNVLQALQSLALRIDPAFGGDWSFLLSKEEDPVLPTGVTGNSPGIGSSLAQALDRIVPPTLTETDIKYCHGATALQKSAVRSIEDIAVDGRSRMQYTYVCKFCFLQISNYQRTARYWSPYEWVALAKSHVVACTSWLDARALFKCIDCDKLGREHVTIDAEEFIIHTQEHVQDVLTGQVTTNSVYVHERFQGGNVPWQRSAKQSMTELVGEITACEEIVALELAEDPVVQDAKASAEHLFEDLDEGQRATHEPQFKQELPREPQTPVKSRVTLDSASKSPGSNEKHVASTSVPPTPEPPTYAPPFRPTQHSTPAESARTPVSGGTLPMTPVPPYSPEPARETQVIGTPARERELPDRSQRTSKSPPTAERATYVQDTASPSPVMQRQPEINANVLPTRAAVTEPAEGFSACPSCEQPMKLEAMFEHLDTCPGKPDSPRLSAQQDTGNRTQEPMRDAARRRKLENLVPSESTQRVGEAQTSLSVPTRPPPIPPQQLPRPTINRKVTPAVTSAEAAEKYAAQRYSGPAGGRPQDPSTPRNSQDLYARQNSMPGVSGQRTPQPPGGLQDWENYPTFDQWQQRN
jgi:hypothetical protein